MELNVLVEQGLSMGSRTLATVTVDPRTCEATSLDDLRS